MYTGVELRRGPYKCISLDKVERESEVSSENLGIMAKTRSGSNLCGTENAWHCDIDLCAASKNQHPMIEEGRGSWPQLYRVQLMIAILMKS